MSKQVKIDATSVTPSKPILKRDFGSEVQNVKFTLPVNSPSKKVRIELLLCGDYPDVSSYYYDFDYLPNVDVNQYLQYVVSLYNNGITSYPIVKDSDFKEF